MSTGVAIRVQIPSKNLIRAFSEKISEKKEHERDLTISLVHFHVPVHADWIAKTP